MSPVVPRFRSTGSLAPLPSARRTAAETAASLGADVQRQSARTATVAANVLSNAAGDLMQIDARQQAYKRREEDELAERQDRLVVLTGENALRGWLSETETGDDSPYKRQGLNAVGVSGEYSTRYNKKADEVAALMKNERQKMAFEEVRARLGLGFKVDLERHTLQQVDRAEQNQSTATLANITSTVGRHATDARRVSEEVARGEALLIEQATLRGWSSEQAQQALLQFRSGAYKSVITGLTAQGMSSAALAYFNSVKDQISTEVRTELQGNITIGTVKDESRKHADRILAKGGTLTEQLEAAKSIEDTDIYDATVARLKQGYAVRKSEEQESYATFVDGIYTRLSTTKGNINLLTPADRQRLGKDITAVEAYANHLSANKPIETNDKGWRRYWELVDLAIDNPEAFLAENPQTESVRGAQMIGRTQVNALMEMRARIRTGQQKPQAALSGSSPMVRQVVADTWTRFTGQPMSLTQEAREKNDTLARRQAGMRTAVALEIERRKLSADATTGDVQQVVDEVFSTIAMTQPAWAGGPFGLGASAAVYKPIYDLTIADVPAKEKALIIEALRVTQTPVNDANILSEYINYLVKRQGGGR